MLNEYERIKSRYTFPFVLYALNEQLKKNNINTVAQIIDNERKSIYPPRSTRANTKFIAKLKTPPQNSGKIKIGQQVNIKLNNYPDTEFGSLSGKISKVSAITNQEGFYIIDVSLASKLISSYQKEIEFKPEMQGTAEIITENLRLIERFFYQFKEIFKA